MTTFLIIIGVLTLIVLLLYGNLIVSLLVSIKGKQRLTAQLVETNNPNAINILFDSKYRCKIVVDSISIDRRLAEALAAKAPSGFNEIECTIPNERDFEADLSVLLDQYDESQITEDMIREETKKQYKETLRVFEEFRSTKIEWTGHFIIKRGKGNILSIPIKSNGPAKGRIYFNYRARSGILKVLDGCSVDINRDPLGCLSVDERAENSKTKLRQSRQ